MKSFLEKLVNNEFTKDNYEATRARLEQQKTREEYELRYNLHNILRW